MSTIRIFAASIRAALGCAILTATPVRAEAPPASAPSSTAPWHTSGVGSTRTLSLADFHADAGMNAKSGNALLLLSLTGVNFSNVLLNERIDYSEKCVVRVDVKEVKRGGITLQAVCYDEQGIAQQSIDLLSDINSAGLYEVPLRIYRTPLSGAKQVGFRIWLSGNDPTAAISGVMCGWTK